MLSSSNALVYWQHLAFHLQKHIVIFLFSLAVRNSPSSFHVLVFWKYCWFSAPADPNTSILSPPLLRCFSLNENFRPPSALYHKTALSSYRSFIFFFLYFFSFNKQFFTSLKMYIIWTSFNEDYENPQNESRKEKFCSFLPQNIMLTFSWDRLLGNPLHSRDCRGFHISDLPQPDCLKNYLKFLFRVLSSHNILLLSQVHLINEKGNLFSDSYNDVPLVQFVSYALCVVVFWVALLETF